jgi:hypothetical protein
MPNSAASGPLGFYKVRFEVENSLTRGVLKAIPADKLDYRPHERSPSTGQIAWTIVRGLFIRMGMAAQGTSDVIRYAPAAVLRSSGRRETSYGCSISTRFITAASFPPICAPWAPRSHRFTERRATHCLDVFAESKYAPKFMRSSP